MAAANTKTVDTNPEDVFSQLLAQLPFASQDDLEVSYSSYDEAVAAAELDGLTEEDTVFVRSNFRVITDKEELLSVPHMIRAIRFSKDDVSERPYVIVYAVARLPKGDEMVIYTDGSTGVFAQLVRAMQKRMADGHKTPTQWFNCVNGLDKSEYNLTEVDGKPRPAKPGEKVSGQGTTYYIG